MGGRRANRWDGRRRLLHAAPSHCTRASCFVVRVGVRGLVGVGQSSRSIEQPNHYRGLAWHLCKQPSGGERSRRSSYQ